MEKHVEFFYINYKDFNMYSGSENDDKRHEEFINLIKHSLENKEYMLKLNNKEEEPSIVIEIIETENNYIFGLVGKLNDLSNKTLLRIRGKGIEEIHKTSSPKDLDFYVENFTYFYIRISDLMCGVLQNSSAPSFRKHFAVLLKNELNYKESFFDDINIVDVIDRDIRKKLMRFKEILSLNIGYRNNESKSLEEGFLDLDHEFGISQSQIEYANIDLRIKTGINQNKMKKKLSDYTKYEEFNNFKVNMVDDKDAVKCIDLIKSIITQKVYIDIEERHLMSTDGEQKIKEELKKALQSI